MASTAVISRRSYRRSSSASGVALLLATLSLGLSVAASDRLPAPFLWIGASAFAVVGAAAWRAARSSTRVLWLNVGAVIAALGLFEAYLFVTERPAPAERFEGSYTQGYFIDHPVLGYAPMPGVRATAIKFVDERLVYDVVYTIDRHGLRATPSASGVGASRSILFFGGSVTFGEGVDDEHSMPYRVGEHTAGRYAAHNFGFHGYGPHQMLAALQSGLVARIVSLPPRFVVYQAIPAHVARAVGLAPWDPHGPRYELEHDGSVRRAGHFDDSRGWLRDRASTLLASSRAYSKLLGRARAMRDDDLRRYLGIVRGARDRVVDGCRDCEFHVILWGYPHDRVFRQIAAGLAEADIPTHRVMDILPAYQRAPETYELSPDDRHPNSRAHALIAEYVSARIVERADAQSTSRSTPTGQ